MKALAMLGTALLLSFGACTGFREARPGVYRSPQPDEDRLVRRIEQYGIRTVVCLRGGRSARSSERASDAADVAFYAVPMSATRLPHPDALLALWQIAAEAERPVLLHCRAGVDRTGLACAIVALHDTADLAAARSELALVPNGHLGAFGTEAMDEVLDRYEPHAGELSFPDWVERIYAADYAADFPADSSVSDR
jgi:protein tyrosine phosphatase (PTP) superfamily phosphohydrolase (DUF442 family)